MTAPVSAQPYQPHERLLSPRCGLHGEHDECRSAICQCDCHLAAARAEARTTTTTEERTDG